MNAKKETKILHISHSLDTGGGPLYIKKIVDDLPRYLHYVAGNRGYYFDVIESALGASRIIALSGKRIISNLLLLYQFVKKEKITIIHCHGRGAGVYARLLKFFNPSLKIVYTVHGFHPETVPRYFRYFYILLERFFLKYTDKVIHVSRSEKQRFQQYVHPGLSKCVYIPNYIALDAERALFPPLRLDSNKINFLYIGRLSPEKGIDILMDAIPFVEVPEFKLFVIGYGVWEEHIVTRIQSAALKDKITYLGKINNAGSLIHFFDGIVIPSRFEGMPFICLEAMAAKVPIVATPAVGITDLVDHQTAYLAQDFSARKVAEAIVCCLKDIRTASHQIEIKVTNNHHLVKREFSREKNIGLLQSIYNTL